MAATASARVTSLLLRAGLVMGLMAIIAGIFGMHVVSGAHTMPAAAQTSPAHQPLATGEHGSHSGVQSPPPQTAPTQVTLTSTPSSCSDNGGACPSMSTMDADCVLSPANTSLSAPLPGRTSITGHSVATAGAVHTAHSYLPGSPSPGELCISRT